MQKLILPLILLVVFLVYSPALSVYFSHDDFFNFKVSQTDGTLGGFLNLFGFHPFEERGIAFYRPVFREALFNIFYSLFGLNHLPFRVLSLVIHVVNIVLVYILMQRLFRKQELSLFVAFFFGITAGNVGSLYYLTGGVQSLGATMFVLFSLILFLNGRLFYSFLSFILSLGSHELAIVTPLVIVGVSLLRKQSLARVLPFFVAAGLFAILDFFLIGFSSGEQQYQLTFSLKGILNSLAWYGMWALGFPEMLVDFVGPKLSLNPNLMKFWGDYYGGIFFFAGVALVIFIASFIWALLRVRIWTDKKFWFLALWFPIAISPILLFPLHKQTYYLNPALPAFWGAVGFVIFKVYANFRKRNNNLAGFALGAFIASIFLLSVDSAVLANNTYPAANRGKIAKKLLNDISFQYPSLPKGAVIYFKNDSKYPKISGDWGGSSKQASFVLNGSDALQLLYRDPKLRVMYEDLDDQIPPDAYSLVARIN